MFSHTTKKSNIDGRADIKQCPCGLKKQNYMAEIKFTTDGKKVVVIGSLNSQEKIVQEIFIVDGSEIPSGEHFVVKSLHDSPAVSWKEKEIKSIEERFATDSLKYRMETEKLYKEHQKQASELRAKLQYVGKALKNADKQSFETLVNYITGKINWIIYEHYSSVELIPIEKFNQMYENKLRLISLFGSDDGSFTYAIGDYYDRSGSTKTFHPFDSYDEALVEFKILLLKKDVSEENIKLAKQFGISYPADKVESYIKKRIESYNKNIYSAQKNIEQYKLSIDEILKLNNQ